MKPVEDVRRDNLYILVGLNESVTAVGKLSGISRATLSAVLNGKALSMKHARKLETKLDKPFGWMDKEHDDNELSPAFDKSVLKATMEFIEGVKPVKELYDDLNIDGKVDYFAMMYEAFTDPQVRKLPTNSILKIMGIKNDETTKHRTTSKSGKGNKAS